MIPVQVLEWVLHADSDTVGVKSFQGDVHFLAAAIHESNTSVASLYLRLCCINNSLFSLCTYADEQGYLSKAAPQMQGTDMCCLKAYLYNHHIHIRQQDIPAEL